MDLETLEALLNLPETASKDLIEMFSIEDKDNYSNEKNAVLTGKIHRIDNFYQLLNE